MKTNFFDYCLPAELIAQKPAFKREQSNLMIIDRKRKKIKATKFYEIPNYFEKGDALVLNNTKVIPARILAKRKTGAKIEILLLKNLRKNTSECLLKPLRKVRVGEILKIGRYATCKIKEKISGKAVVEFDKDIRIILKKMGKIPLPPYIKEKNQDRRRYQTVFARRLGSIAAPTAGLHFTKNLLRKLEKTGVKICFVTLHIGFTTFNKISSENIEEHSMEAEFFEISRKTAAIVNSAIRKNKRIISCGTTTTRALESNCKKIGGKWMLNHGKGFTNLFITPSYKFKIIRGLITNFHLPRTTLIVLVSAFAGRDIVMQAYSMAIKKKWRFFSFGDCMLIL